MKNPMNPPPSGKKHTHTLWFEKTRNKEIWSKYQTTENSYPIKTYVQSLFSNNLWIKQWKGGYKSSIMWDEQKLLRL